VNLRLALNTTAVKTETVGNSLLMLEKAEGKKIFGASGEPGER
jgi:hypothetical protein